VRAALVWLASVLTLGLLLFAYRHLAVLASRSSEPFVYPLVNELTAAVVVGCLFFGIRAFVRKYPLRSGTWRAHLPLYAPALLGFAFLSTTAMWALRSVVYPLVGLGSFDYGVMPLRYFMELPLQAIAFAAMVVTIQYVDAYKAGREREVEAARLEQHLAEAQLRNLRLQLQPHFLFNALNTISSEMYRDPAAADEMLSQLAELLRASLATSQNDEIALSDELGLLDRYLALMRARFGSRLRVTIETDPGVERALVPSMILQPLVENAIRHGLGSVEGTGNVAVRARREDVRLVLEVEDDGMGTRGRADLVRGIGLTATAERLRLLYREEQQFSAGDGPSRGFLVRAVLPFHERPLAAAGSPIEDGERREEPAC
jgi:two-component system, LytTR family, sensor kinase